MEHQMEQATSTPNESLNTVSAAQAFESLLSKADEPEQNEPEAVEEPVIEETQDDPEPESEEEVSEDSQEQPEEAEPMIKVTIDGEEVEVPLSEAKKGYQRTADYTRKTQQLAEERKAVETAKRQADAQLGQYENAIQQALTMAQRFAPAEPNWDQLYNDDPLEFVRQKEAWRDHKEQLARLQSEQQLIQQHRQQQHLSGLQSHLENESKALTEKIPAWKDEAKAKAERSALLEYGKSLGYTADELSKVYDHRVVMMMREAMLYRQLQSKKTLTDNKVRQAPKMVKPGTSAPPPNKHDDAMKALRKSGKQSDAARAFMNFI